jgi:signal transduction histidine kinase
MAGVRRFGIQSKVIVSLLVVGLLPGIVGLILTFIFIKKTIHQAIGSNFQELARESASEIDAFLRREVEDAQDIARFPAVIESLRQGRFLDSVLRYIEDIRRLKSEEYERISILDRSGRVLVSTSPVSGQGRGWPLDRILSRPGRVYIGPLYGDRIDVVVPVMGPDSRPLGVVGMTLRTQEVNEMILRVRIGETGHAMLVSSEGTPLICPILPPKRHLLNLPLMTMITQDHPGWGIARDDGHGGQDSIVGFAPVAVPPGTVTGSFGDERWYTFVRQDPRETYSPIYILMGNVAVVGFGMVALLSMFGFYISATLVRPIQALRRWTESSVSGPHENRTDPTGFLESTIAPLEEVRTGDEIEDLSIAFAQMTRARAENERLLIRSEKLAAIGQLAAIVAHEIRNPLNAISGSAVSLRPLLPQEGREVRALDLIVSETDKLGQFVFNLLTMVQEPIPKLVEIHLPALVEDALQVLELQGKLHQIRLVRDFPESLPRVRVDPDQIRQVLLNLLSNAVEAMPEGGTLTLSGSLDEAGRLSLRIGDTGFGIPSENRERLFEPFFTTKLRGTGLGLSISRGVMERHGGHIALDDRTGTGATFCLRFPIRGGFA